MVEVSLRGKANGLALIMQIFMDVVSQRLSPGKLTGDISVIRVRTMAQAPCSCLDVRTVCLSMQYYCKCASSLTFKPVGQYESKSDMNKMRNTAQTARVKNCTGGVCGRHTVTH